MVYHLVLDEATSVVDEETETKLYEKCRELGMCLVSISHRASLRKVHDVIISGVTILYSDLLFSVS